jgi:iron complex outermembrane recepter protein
VSTYTLSLRLGRTQASLIVGFAFILPSFLAAQVVPLSPVVVTATHSQQPLVVIADPRAPAQPLPAQDGAEALRGIPGFAVIRKGGADGDPVLRGMAGSRLGILIDGDVVLGGCGNRMDPPTAYVHPAAFDQLTVMKGPQCVSHGPGYTAGVVRFERTVPRYSDRTVEFDASATLGSFGRNDQMLRARAGAAAGYAEISGTRSASDDYRTGDGTTVHSAYVRWNTQATLGWTPSRDTVVEFALATGDGEAAYADRAMDGVAFARDHAALRFEHTMAHAPVRSIAARVYVNTVDHVMDNFSLRGFAPSGSMAQPAISNPDRQTVGGRAAAKLAAGGHMDIELGLDFQENRHRVRLSRDQSALDYRTLPRREDARFEQIGFFAEGTHSSAEHLRLIGGVRGDAWRLNDRRATIGTGMAGTAINPSADRVRRELLGGGFLRLEHEHGGATAYVGLGYAERFPDYWEIFSKESAGSVSAFDTRAERTSQIDAGLIAGRGKITTSVSIFANRVDDYILIQSGVRKGMRTATIARNIDAATWGGEASALWRFARNWQADVSAAYVRGDNRTDETVLAQQPPLEGRIGVAWSTNKWSVGALVRAAARQHRVAINQGNIAGQDIGPSSGFAAFAMNAGWSFRPYARLTVGVDNLFDAAYAEHISRSGSAIPGYTQIGRVMEPGRAGWLKLDFRR